MIDPSSPSFPSLPIESSLPEIRAALRDAGTLVLQAPPGAGKTTRVPLALFNEDWLGRGRIIVLEPRRLAARAAAGRMAQLMGEQVGETIGYRIRHETRIGLHTRIEVVTEGILTRMLQSDPGLDGVALIVFDEFHERSLHADLGLALALQSRAILRNDLRLLVMSATLDGGPVSALLGGAPVVTSEGRSWPVETRYWPPRRGARLEATVASTIRDALDTDPGDLLVFLPGASEIRRVSAALAGVAGADVIPLHGNLPPEMQDRAIRPSPPGRRKVVLATSIAETSLTIDGVQIVVDAGLSRVPRYSPRSGMTRLATVRVSRASADQRRGRAGRVAPGICYRLWAEAEDAQLLPAMRPEILESDLAPLALDLAAAGVVDPSELSWLDPPPSGAYAEARALLTQLGALDSAGRLTDHGRAMARLALHPRLAHMVIRGTELGSGRTACSLAAILTERDLLRWGEGVPDADLGTRLDILRGTVERHDVDREALRRARTEARSCERGRQPGGDTVSLGALTALAYPDRIARRRKGETGRYLLRNGQGATLEPQALSREEFLVAADLDVGRRDGQGRVLLAASLSLEEVEEHAANGIEREDVIEWDRETGSVITRRRSRLGAIVLRDGPLDEPDPDLVKAALLDHVREVGIAGLPWEKESRAIRSRLAFLHLDPSWPDQSDQGLLSTLEEWLAPAIRGIRRLEDLVRVDLTELLQSRLRWDQRARLDEWAPRYIQVPSGSHVAVNYEDPENPVLAVRLQEMFGLADTPRVALGRIPVTLHLLSPARRPQVTRDLAGFWRTTYFEVRKDLKGRYPKHFWPDDPLRAEPTRHVKKRGTRPGTQA